MTYPTDLPSLTNPGGSDKLDNPDHATQHATANDLIEALATKLGVDSSAVATTIDYFLKHASGAYRTHKHDGSSDDGAKLDWDDIWLDAVHSHASNAEGGSGIAEADIVFGASGHDHSGTTSGNLIPTAGIEDSAITQAKLITKLLAGWGLLIASGTRTAATTFTVAGDYTDRVSIGDEVELTDTTTKYFYITATPTYSSPNTTFTISGGSDYTLAGNPSNIYFSKASSPVGFPQWFALAAPTWTVSSFDNGSGGQPTTTDYKFCISGRTATVRCLASGTKATTNNVLLFATAGLPVAPVGYSGVSSMGSCEIDVPASNGQTGSVLIVGSSMYLQFTTNITDNTTIGRASFTISYEI